MNKFCSAGMRTSTRKYMKKRNEKKRYVYVSENAFAGE